MTYFGINFSALKKKVLRPSLTHLLLVMSLAAMPLLLGLTGGPGAVAEDNSAEYGKQLFTKRCGGCHALDHDQTGPRLGDVYGRKAGIVATFRYSDAMKATEFTW